MAKKEFCTLSTFVSQLPDGPKLLSLEDGCLIITQIIINSKIFKIHLAWREDKQLEVDVYWKKGWIFKDELHVGSWIFKS
jgi:hypothetical protein